MKAIHWTGTLNNYTEDEYQKIPTFPDLQYYVIGREIAQTGTPHLQFFLSFKMQTSMATIKRLLGNNTVHLEVKYKQARMSRTANYCKKGVMTHQEWLDHHEDGPTYGKDAVFLEGGTLPQDSNVAGNQKMMERYTNLRKAAEENRFDEIPADLYIKHYGTIQRIRMDHRNKVKPPSLTHKRGGNDLPNLWIYGPTNTGKSWKARHLYPEDTVYLKMLNKWWEDYNDEPNVLLEDIGLSHLWLGDFLKIWADIYPFRNEVKHGSLVMRPATITVTSNYHPKEIWPDPAVHLPIMGRFTIEHRVELVRVPVTLPPQLVHGLTDAINSDEICLTIETSSSHQDQTIQ